MLVICLGGMFLPGKDFSVAQDNAVAAPQSRENISAEGIREILERQLDLMHRMSSEPKKEEDLTDRMFKELVALAFVRDNVLLVREIVRFQATHYNEYSYAVSEFALRFSSAAGEDILDAILPEWNNPDEKMQKTIRRFLQKIEFVTSEAGPDFGCYRGYIEARRVNLQEVEPRLIERMFGVDPGKALLTVLNIYEPDRMERKPILWAEKVVRDNRWKQRHGFVGRSEVEPATLDEIEKLSKNPAWWVRLYVAEIYKRDPEFCNPAVVDRLKSDVHPLVKKALNSPVNKDSID